MIEKFNESKTQELNGSEENSLNGNDWTPEKGFTSVDFNKTSSPRPAFGNVYCIAPINNFFYF